MAYFLMYQSAESLQTFAKGAQKNAESRKGKSLPDEGEREWVRGFNFPFSLLPYCLVPFSLPGGGICHFRDGAYGWDLKCHPEVHVSEHIP